MNLDSGQTSFIGLYRTTDLDELSQNFVGVDTVGYYEFDDERRRKKEKMGIGSLTQFMSQRH